MSSDTRGSFSCAAVGIQNSLPGDLLVVLLWGIQHSLSRDLLVVRDKPNTQLTLRI